MLNPYRAHYAEVEWVVYYVLEKDPVLYFEIFWTDRNIEDDSKVYVGDKEETLQDGIFKFPDTMSPQIELADLRQYPSLVEEDGSRWRKVAVRLTVQILQGNASIISHRAPPSYDIRLLGK